VQVLEFLFLNLLQLQTLQFRNIHLQIFEMVIGYNLVIFRRIVLFPLRTRILAMDVEGVFGVKLQVGIGVFKLMLLDVL